MARPLLPPRTPCFASPCSRLGCRPRCPAAAPAPAALAAMLLLGLPGLLGLLPIAGCDESGTAVRYESGDSRIDTTSAPLTLRSVRPTEVPASGNVPALAVGTGFAEGMTVTVGGQTAAGVELLDRYGTTLLFTVPPGSEGQKADVVVAHPSGATARIAEALTYGPPLPPPDPAVDPLAAATVAPIITPADGGGLLVVTGRGFVAGVEVTLGGRPGGEPRVLDERGTLLSFMAPPGKEGQQADLRLLRGSESATLTAAVTYGPAAAPRRPEQLELTLLSLSPSTVPANGGLQVVARGSGFVLEGMTLTVGGTALSFQVLDTSGTVLSFVSPPGEEGQRADVVLVRGEGERAALPGGLTFGPPLGGEAQPPLTVEAVIPGIGSTAGGEQVTVTGQGFRQGARVALRDRPAELLLIVSSRTLLVHTPPATAGPADVTVTNPSGASSTLEGSFTYVEPAPAAPVVLEVHPQQGPVGGGTEILVAGSGFDEEAVVEVGGTATEVLLREGEGAIIALTPPAAAAVPVAVVVRNGDGLEGSLPQAFTYLAEPPPPELTLQRAI
ncbi:MAG: hypothetical protein FJ125_15475, partial [Deltaproteobacteria bacterium]|nr:hypothetical protein [Deltaproteobacteria bacterium]